MARDYGVVAVARRSGHGAADEKEWYPDPGVSGRRVRRKGSARDLRGGGVLHRRGGAVYRDIDVQGPRPLKYSKCFYENHQGSPPSRMKRAVQARAGRRSTGKEEM